jgi:hypothetical protein
MNFDVNVAAGLVAGVAAMIPGSIIYAPGVLGKRWMQEIGTSPEKQKAAGGSPAKAVGMMLVTSLINGLAAALFVGTMGAEGVGQALEVCLILSWFLVSASLAIVFFEQRSWAWFGISALSHVTTFAVIGVVLGLLV